MFLIKYFRNIQVLIMGEAPCPASSGAGAGIASGILKMGDFTDGKQRG
jgi:hypothetical protein